MNDDIHALLRERAALRGLADMAVKARGELGDNDSSTALFIERLAFGIAERWAQVDREARQAIKRSGAYEVEAPRAQLLHQGRAQSAMQCMR